MPATLPPPVIISPSDDYRPIPRLRFDDPPPAPRPIPEPIPVRNLRFSQWLPLLALLPFVAVFAIEAMLRLMPPTGILPVEEGWLGLTSNLFDLGGSLVLGRVISLLAVGAAMLGIYRIIWDRTLRQAPAMIGALMLLVFQEATGKALGLATPAVPALALASWATLLTFQRKASPTSMWIGVSLGAAASLLAVVYLPLLITLIFKAVFKDGFRQKESITDGAALAVFLVLLFLGVFGQRETGTVTSLWSECLRHVWLLWLLFPVWGFLKKGVPPIRGGLPYFVPISILLTTGAVAFAASGDPALLLPLFFATCIIVGMLAEGIRRTLPWRGRFVFDGVLLLLLGLQLFQPWNMPPTGNANLNQQIINEAGATHRAELLEYNTNLIRLIAVEDMIAQAEAAEQEPSPQLLARADELDQAMELAAGASFTYFLGRLSMAGLFYMPQTDGSGKAHKGRSSQ